MKHLWTVILLAVVVGLLMLYAVSFIVDYKDVAIVTTLGKAGAPLEGRNEPQAGFHWKWPLPVQKLHRYDGRTFVFDDTHNEVTTNDKLNILVTVYCAWQIKDADQFLRKAKTVENAQDLLRGLVRATKSNVVSQHNLSEFLNTEPGQMHIDDIEGKIEDVVAKEALSAYGIRTVTLGIRNFGLPEEVTKQVIENMNKERSRFADLYRASGQADANLIRERANSAREQVLEFARARAKNIRAEGNAVAAQYYTTFRRNEPFAIFLRELEALREVLQQDTVIVGEADVMRSWGFFRDGPSVPDLTTAPAPATQPAKTAEKAKP